jgi:hypothetical protein
MKKLFVIMSLLLLAVALFGCGDSDNSATTQNQLPPQEYNKTFTLQGRIMDAVTGAPLGNSGDSTISMFLIQGVSDRGPNKLHTDPNDALVGEYAFAGIPAFAVGSDVPASSAVYKVVVKKKGYQDFAANVQFDAAIAGGANTIAIDGTLNMIGNIYLFPIGAVPGTVHVHVLSSHLIPVPGVTVLLQQNIANIGGTIALNNDRLAPVGGLYTSMSATTDANGVANFVGADLPLVLGGSYVAVAEAIEFQGDELATTSTGQFMIGVNSLHQNITMGSAGPQFFATSASNQVPGTIASNGVLSITFNEPITLTTTFFTATLSSTATGSVTSPVTATLSNNNQTLTFTPAFAPVPTTPGVSVAYGVIGASPILLQRTQVAPVCDSAPTPGTFAPCTLFGGANPIINITTGNVISDTVLLKAN